jgi:hypothetical protein
MITGGMDVYGYADGDPVNFKDSFGLDKCPKDFSVSECVSSPEAGVPRKYKVRLVRRMSPGAFSSPYPYALYP